MAHFAALATPPLTNILWFDYSEIPAGDYAVPAHLHHFHQLDVILQGETEVHIEGMEPFAARGGAAWLIPPLLRHAYRATLGYRLGSVKFHLAPACWPLFGAHFRRFNLSNSLLDHLDSAGERLRAEAPLAGQQLDAVVALCLVDCLEKTSSASGENDGFDNVRRELWPLLERIESDPYAAWSVARMATEFHLSPNYFSSVFHRLIGIPPQRYLLETRMRRSAAELCSEPPPPIKEIAHRAGYATVPAFTRAFKQVFQTGPAAYRTETVKRRFG